MVTPIHGQGHHRCIIRNHKLLSRLGRGFLLAAVEVGSARAADRPQEPSARRRGRRKEPNDCFIAHRPSPEKYPRQFHREASRTRNPDWRTLYVKDAQKYGIDCVYEAAEQEGLPSVELVRSKSNCSGSPRSTAGQGSRPSGARRAEDH
jgi:hypothetical protein